MSSNSSVRNSEFRVVPKLESMTDIVIGAGEEVSIISKDGDSMNDDSILKAYMDKVDADQREMRVEMRDREERINRSITDSEQRMNEKMDRIERLIVDQNNRYEEKTEKLEDKMNKLGEKFDESVEKIKRDKVSNSIGIAAIVIAAGALFIALYQMYNGIIPLLTR